MPPEKERKERGRGQERRGYGPTNALRAQEAEAKNFLRGEVERHQRDELEERITFLRDEQLRALRDKDNQLASIQQRLAVVTAAKVAYEAAHEAEKQQPGRERDLLLNEGNFANVGPEQLQETLKAERRAIADNRQHLRSQAREALAKLEVLRYQLRHMSEEKDFQERSRNLERREMGRDIEQAVSTNRTLREAVAERDTDGRKSIASLHLPNAQIDSATRRSSARRRSAPAVRRRWLA